METSSWPFLMNSRMTRKLMSHKWSNCGCCCSFSMQVRKKRANTDSAACSVPGGVLADTTAESALAHFSTVAPACAGERI